MQTKRDQYARTFCDQAAASSYEKFYIRGTSDEAIWSIEQEFLADFFERHRSMWPACAYLDFACGTGRVISFMETRVATSRGIDVSPEMLKIAAAKVQRSELICADITKEALPGPYDLITAFRFFLNAEPDLRVIIMKALASQLRDENSRLVFNNHGNPFSYKAVAWPFHRLRQLINGRPATGNYLTDKEIRALLIAADLELVERSGYGVISPKLFRLSPSRARDLERRGSASAFARKFGVNQIYVARLRTRPGIAN